MESDNIKIHQNAEVDVNEINLDEVYIIEGDASDDAVWAEFDETPADEFGSVSPEDDLVVVESDASGGDVVWVELDDIPVEELGEVSPEEDLCVIEGVDSDADEVLVLEADGYEDVEADTLSIGEYDDIESMETLTEDEDDFFIEADDFDEEYYVETESYDDYDDYGDVDVDDVDIE